MKYALLAYSTDVEIDTPDDQADRPLDPAMATALDRQSVTGWVRLRSPGSATSLTVAEGKPLLIDGPFVGSKEFLGGVILVEAADLDAALAIAAELQGLRNDEGRIEVRPILQEHFSGA
jgi:hypothetical protein